MQRAVTQRRQIKAIKGVRDILPPESALWNRVEQTARDVFATYGYGEIRLPIFEETELFARSVGAETDIVSKEMYTFEDRPAELQVPPHWEQFAAFIQQVAEAITAGLIPTTDFNRDRIKQLRESYDQLADLFKRLWAGDKSIHGQIQPLFFRCVVLAHDLQLGDEVSLRPEATASVCRAYIEHGMHTLPGDVKLYYIGPMFRRERPQKGRYRQFYQIGAEVLGQSDAPAIDAEVIEMLMHFFTRVGLCSGDLTSPSGGVNPPLQGPTLYINSIGCRECRPKYVEKLREALQKVKDQLGADSQRRIETNPLRVLDSKLPEEQAIIEKLPRIGEHLCAACREHVAALQEQLKLRGIAYEINWRLVRGLDYYMRTTFEITAPGLGAQNAVCGGGRYDGLVELLGGPPTKGIGFAIGTDRLVLSLQEKDKRRRITETSKGIEAASGKAEVIEPVDFAVVATSEATWAEANRVAVSLRKVGLRTYLAEPDTRLKKALELASKRAAKVTIIVSEDEIERSAYKLRVMQTFAEGEPKDALLAKDRLAVFGKLSVLGADLERSLQTWVVGVGSFGKNVGLTGIIKYLKFRSLLPQDLLNRLEHFTMVRNLALHGRLEDLAEIATAIAEGSLVLAELRTLPPPE